MPHELLKLRVQEISAVDRPANRRRFLVVKREKVESSATSWSGVLRRIGQRLGWSADEIQRAEQEAETFDDMMARRRIGHVVSSLYDHYGALLDTLTSIANSDQGGKPALVRAAIDDYLGSLQGALDDVIASAFSKADVDDGETQTALTAAQQRLAQWLSVEAPMSKQTTTPAFDLNAIPEAHRATVKAEIDRLAAEVQKAQKPTNPPAPEDVLKQADPAVRQLITDLQSRVEKAEGKATEAETAATTERTLRLKAESIAKAQAAYGGITVDFTKLGEALLALEGKVEASTIETIEQALKAASEQLKTQALFKELGHSAPPGPDSAVGKIQKHAAELRKADPTLTAEQAEAKALEDHPNLYGAYLAETSAQ